MIDALRAIATIINGLVYLARLYKENRHEAWVQKTSAFFEKLSQLDTEEKRSEAAKKINSIFDSI